MKTIVMMVFALVLNVNTTIKNQESETKTIVGIFDGYDEEDGYAFIIKDENGKDEIMYFTDITDEALKTNNLQSDKMIGTSFEITYEVEELESDDDEVYEVYKIIKLVKK